MAIGSKRGLRSILSRKTSPYAHLKGDENYAGTMQETEEPKAIEPTVIKQKPVTVKVDESIDAKPELECVDSLDRIIICTNTDTSKEDEKESEDDVYTATRNAAIAIVRDASLMTDLVAKRMALASTRSFTSVLNSPTDIRRDNGEEKTETEEIPHDEINVADNAVAETNAVQSAQQCGNELVESSKEKVGTALQQTQNKANDLFEASVSSGKDFMSVTEAGSQAAIVERLPLSPLLEQASERMEAVMVQVVDEVQEFFLDHWTMLQDFIATRKQKQSERSVENVNAENPTPSTTIEVQVQAAATNTTN